MNHDRNPQGSEGASAAHREPPSLSATARLKLALLQAHTITGEDAGADPYNSRVGSQRGEVWGRGGKKR